MLTRALQSVVRTPLRPFGALLTPGMGAQPIRRFNIHEYQSMQLFKKYNVPCMGGDVASTPDEAEKIASSLRGPDYVVKAQVLAGGRGKGHFNTGFEGGVQVCDSVETTRDIASKMLGNRLITKQTGADGKPCNKVVVTERLYLRRESYFAILMDRETGGPVLVGSPCGGMNIEEVAAETPEKIFKEPVSIGEGVSRDAALRLARNMGFESDTQAEQAANVIENLYKLFADSDSTLIEINPLAETHDGNVLCIDAKLNFDDNAEYRQKEIFAMRDTTQEDPREVEAEKSHLNYIGLDGDIGCLVNGAGLAMATMDVIKLHGGEPANFLDLGGGATAEQVTQAFALLDSDPKVKSILVNIFGGIMRCDVIALGLIQAVQKLGVRKPLVVRLAGTNVKEALKLIEDSGLRMLTADDLGEAAQKVVRVTEILKSAEAASINVEFTLPV